MMLKLFTFTLQLLLIDDPVNPPWYPVDAAAVVCYPPATAIS
jgi:hypothetical protein